ncbi:hypothetical protein BD410DRAFT_135033 [Rickenella mellea]|uniref:Uncharacterized protein n=1 Tax=Rickenella mellea TaxID=50990 RepID=A0A4Y7Q9Z4_9AGAM|nr:hypothetical protein BD410DRAFT_135033 [Rickenella mellea]
MSLPSFYFSPLCSGPLDLRSHNPHNSTTTLTPQSTHFGYISLFSKATIQSTLHRHDHYPFYPPTQVSPDPPVVVVGIHVAARAGARCYPTPPSRSTPPFPPFFQSVCILGSCNNSLSLGPRMGILRP